MEDTFAIVFEGQTTNHIRHIDAKYRSLLFQTIHAQLKHELSIPTANRKYLDNPNNLGDALWEIRRVIILAIGLDSLL